VNWSRIAGHQDRCISWALQTERADDDVPTTLDRSTARTMAQQLAQPAIAQLLGRTLAEEKNADSVPTDCAQPLMSEARLATPER